MKNALLALLLTTPIVASAQSAEILPGRRIRVETARASTAGALSSQTADSLVLVGDAGTRVAVARSEITGLRLSEGKSRSLGAAKGAGWGAAVLGGGGALMVASGGSPEWAPAFAIVGGIEGAIIGGVIGTFVGAERWTTVSSGLPRVSVGTMPSGATRVGLSISF